MEPKKANPPDYKTLIKQLTHSLSAKPNLTPDSKLAVLMSIISALHQTDQKDEYLLLEYYRTLLFFIQSYDLKFLNNTNKGEAFFISIDLFLKLLKVFMMMNNNKLA